MIFFTEDMELGIPHIDSQHKSLVDFANKASILCADDPAKENIKEYLEFLGEYVTKHFSDEEYLQIECEYPRYKQHKEIHDEFVRTFESMCIEYEKYGATEKLAKIIDSRVSGWIVNHIKMEDVIFGKYYMCNKVSRLKTFVSD